LYVYKMEALSKNKKYYSNAVIRNYITCI